MSAMSGVWGHSDGDGGLVITGSMVTEELSKGKAVLCVKGKRVGGEQVCRVTWGTQFGENGTKVVGDEGGGLWHVKQGNIHHTADE